MPASPAPPALAQRRDRQGRWSTAADEPLLSPSLTSPSPLSLALLSPLLSFLSSQGPCLLGGFVCFSVLGPLFLFTLISSGSHLLSCPPCPSLFFLSSDVFHIIVNRDLPQKPWHTYRNTQNYKTLGTSSRGHVRTRR